MLKVTQTDLPEVIILEYEKYVESRGYSYSNFSIQELKEAGIETDFVEENVYCPQNAGTLYGIHFQNHPMAQSKLLYCVRGRGLDFAVDLRKKSKNYKRWTCVELSSDNRKQIHIPKGFGHAFLSLEDNTKVVMRIDNYFNQKYRRGIAWNDPDLNISFPINNPILAQHDIEAPFLKDSDCNL
ncbi:dTDP-4-dehydrorhamnose 3,5-epimerase [Clostridium sp. 19966]|uniref:dTDP-4-dehydrorhamnose 3,5-epimerase n=1 Tax=Clostridium sp. 19966 TaxID=2768166 RepID=UPI0028DFFEF7|nr:dTDP-4-dehydrorhamnose 3,5-epimerase [Clostridium sp. 19966]MDT8718469.1 dTDP-4-dehydrorhamnose 3,5-epimerase [Clostridium sp. 19966]